MNWSDEAIVLSARKHGETSAIVTLMTAAHGAHAGLVRGGAGKRARGLYEPGNFVAADWRARLEDHLGTYTCELLKPNAAPVLDEPMKLAGLSAACAVTEQALPEREPHPELYQRLYNLVATLEAADWMARYVLWELDLLAELGFGLDLSECASTGQSNDLMYVSPKSGRAVSRGAGEPYRDKLLTLPAFLQPPETQGIRDEHEVAPPAADLLAGLELTGYFLDRHAFIHHKSGAPAARTRLVDRLKQSTTISGS